MSVRVGDLVVLAYPVVREISVYDHIHPTFSSRGRSRERRGEPALVVGIGTRQVGGFDTQKVQILLDGEAWWIGAGSVKRISQ